MRFACRWVSNASEWRRRLTYTDHSGATGTWVYEVCTPDHPWGLGCKICKAVGATCAFSNAEVRSWRGSDIRSLRRHGDQKKKRARSGNRRWATRAIFSSLHLREGGGAQFQPGLRPKSHEPFFATFVFQFAYYIYIYLFFWLGTRSWGIGSSGLPSHRRNKAQTNDPPPTPLGRQIWKILFVKRVLDCFVS